MGIKNPNKNDPFSGGHHTFFPFFYSLFFFFTVASYFTVSASEWGDAAR